MPPDALGLNVIEATLHKTNWFVAFPSAEILIDARSLPSMSELGHILYSEQKRKVVKSVWRHITVTVLEVVDMCSKSGEPP